EILPIKSELTDFEIGFNYRDLLEIINALDTDTIQIKFKEPLSASLFYNTEYPENEHNLFLLMPLRL
ncbi:MAG: DNA polymerase III subunit beta, partial [Candidatus Cloacimonadota bacterium]